MYAAQPATIKDIAGRLKVAISTVSRALNDHPLIGLRTKMRVKKLALELNYEPNLKAICFKNKKTFVIGVILPSVKEDLFRNLSAALKMWLEKTITLYYLAKVRITAKLN